jgi:hypothetical protein
MLSWFAIPFYAVRLGFEAQNAAAIGLLRLAAGASNARSPERISENAEIKTAVPELAKAAVPVLAKAAVPVLAKTAVPELAKKAAPSGTKRRRAPQPKAAQRRKRSPNGSPKGRHLR